MTNPTSTTELSPAMEKEIVALVAQLSDIKLDDTDTILQHIMPKLIIKDRSPLFESRVRGFLAALDKTPDQEDIDCAEILSDGGALDKWLEGFKKTFSRRPDGSINARNANAKGQAVGTAPASKKV